LHHIQPDHLGSPRKVIQTSNNTALWNWPILNNPFGETAPTGSITLNLRFPGQYFDAETGLHYNYFRDYEPGTGRYVESDPIGLAAGTQTFAYAYLNPIGFYDEDGLQSNQGERGRTGSASGTNNEFKHYKPDPNRPGNVLDSGGQSGKPRSKPAPGGFGEWWNKKHPDKPFKPRGFIDPSLPLWCGRASFVAFIVVAPGNMFQGEVDQCTCPCGGPCEDPSEQR